MANGDRDLNTIGQTAYECIAEMVSALEVDYDRLATLKEDREDSAFDAESWAVEYPELAEELNELQTAAGEHASRDDAEQRIQEDPLSIEVRSGWTTLDAPLKAEEFNILLSTGGPAVRIVGELDEYMQPVRAWLEVQDWGTPWTQYFGASQETLLTYASQFYYGE